MEIAGDDGSRISLSPKMKTVFGRGSGFNTSDRKVSRRQVLFSIDDSDGQTEPRVSFEVIGKNPVWVRSGENGEVKVFRMYEKGEVAAGDWFCVCGQSPVWFRLKRNYDFQEETKGCTSSSSGEESIDLSKIDPVKEFGFLVIGHEFDQYPKQRIRNIKNWDWFLEEPRGGSDDEDDETFDKREKKLASSRRRKRGKAKGKDDNEEDDDWTGESEEDKELIAKARKIGRPTYSTRSKDCHKHPSSRSGRRLASKRKNKDVKEIEDEDNDNDDTLGGFIVDEEDEEELEELSDVDQEEDDLEEEEFDDDD